MKLWQVGVGWLLHGPPTHARILCDAADAVLLALDFGPSAAVLPAGAAGTERCCSSSGGGGGTPSVLGGEALKWAAEERGPPSAAYRVAPEDRGDHAGLALVEAFLGWWRDHHSHVNSNNAVHDSSSKPPSLHLVTTGLPGETGAHLAGTAAASAWVPPCPSVQPDVDLGYGGLWSSDVQAFVATTSLRSWFPVTSEAPGAGITLQYLLGTLVDDCLEARAATASA